MLKVSSSVASDASVEGVVSDTSVASDCGETSV